MRVMRMAGFAAAAVVAVAGVALVAPAVSGQTRVVERALQDARDRVLTVRPDIQVLELGGPEIGVTIREAEKGEGVVVEDLRSGGPASKAGVRAGDVIVEFDGEKVRSVRHLTRLIRETPAGRSVKMAVMRDGKRVDLAVTPAERSVVLEERLRKLDDQLRSLEGRLRELPDRSWRYEFRLPEMGRLEVFPPGGPLALIERVGPAGARLGVTVQEMTPQLAAYFGAKDGVLVTAVTDGSVAAQAGLKAGDVITAINDRAVNTNGDLVRLLREAGAGAEVTVAIVRDRKPMTVKAKLEGAKTTPRVIRQTAIV